MAIEMIEDCEMSALAPSRLGMKNFVNDRPIKGKKNPRVEENFANLFGSAKKKASFVASAKSKWASVSIDCVNVDDVLGSVQNDSASISQKISSLKGNDLKIAKASLKENAKMIEDLTKFKLINCVSQKATQGIRAGEKEQADSSKPKMEQKPADQMDVKGKGDQNLPSQPQKSMKNTYFIIGGVAIAAIVVVLLMKKK